MTLQCEFCNKNGLPILPMRLAVAQTSAALTPATGAIALGSPAAQYTQRLLRPGYLYVFEEARKRWHTYFVTPNGYLFKRTEGMPLPPLSRLEFSCSQSGHGHLASCVTITNPAKAGMVWLAFSEAEWTPATRQQHETDASVRKAHMTPVDAPSWANGNGKRDAKVQAMSEASQLAEYRLATAEGVKPFAYSPHSFQGRKGQATELLAKASTLLPGGGVLVQVDDPAGIATEIAQLMNGWLEGFHNLKARRRHLAVDSALSQLEGSIKDQAQRDAITEAQQAAARATAGAGTALVYESIRKSYEALGQVSAARLEIAANERWVKYTKKFDTGQRAIWQKAYQQDLRAYDTAHIAPLANAHVAWLTSSTLQGYMRYSFDPADIESGLAYCQQLAQLISGTGDKGACHSQYSQWLQASGYGEHGNYLMRALVLNQNQLADALQGPASSTTDWAGLAWDKAFEAFTKATEKLTNPEPGYAQAGLARVVALVAGPVANAIIESASSGKVSAALFALGVASRQPVVRVAVTGNPDAQRSRLVNKLLQERYSGNASPNQVNQAVALEMKRLRTLGLIPSGTLTETRLMFLDQTRLTGMPDGLTRQQQAVWAAKSLRTAEQIEAIDSASLSRSLSRFGKGSVPYLGGVLGILANYAAYQSTLNSQNSALQKDLSESGLRVQAQGAQLIGAVADVLEKGVKRIPIPSAGLRAAMQRTATTILGGSARLLGVGGSLLMGLIDFGRGIKEANKGDYSAGVAYAASGLLTGAATWLLAIGWTGWGLIVVLFMFIWAIFIMPLLVDDKLQDWMERCVWGKIKDERYKDAETEMADLKIALQG